MAKEPTLPYDVILKTNFDVDIHLEFLDNPFVNKVFSKFKTLVNESKNIYSNKFNYPFGGLDWNKEDIQILQYSLIQVIREINSRVEVKFPIPYSDIIIREGSGNTRNLLNKLHRHFTTYIESGFTTWTFNNSINTQRITSPEYTADVYELVGYVNKIVHKLDRYFYTPEFNTRVKSEPILDEFLIHFDNEIFTPFTENERDYRVNEGDYQIWLPLDCMKGKNLFDCYYDFDNPNEFDIENENIYTGAIALGNREGFYNPELNEWLDANKVQRSIGIPLGYIGFGDSTVKHLSSESIIGIEIIENG